MRTVSLYLQNVLKMLVTACVLPATAAPMLTIICDQPLGTHQRYGASAAERVKAENEGAPEPTPHFVGPVNDGLTMNPTFVVDSGLAYLTVAWRLSESDLALKAKSKTLDIPFCCEPPKPARAKVLIYSPQQITAVEANDKGGVTTYSLFPNLGVAFFASQYIEASGKAATQLSTFAQCTFK